MDISLSLDTIPGVTPERKMVLVEAGTCAAITLGASIVSALAALLVGHGAARTFLGLGLVSYGMIVAGEKPLQAVGFGAFGITVLVELLLAGAWRKIAPAGALPSHAVGAPSPLPYKRVAAWD